MGVKNNITNGNKAEWLGRPPFSEQSPTFFGARATSLIHNGRLWFRNHQDWASTIRRPRTHSETHNQFSAISLSLSLSLYSSFWLSLYFELSICDQGIYAHICNHRCRWPRSLYSIISLIKYFDYSSIFNSSPILCINILAPTVGTPATLFLKASRSLSEPIEL